jgi:hypothetical protein
LSGFISPLSLSFFSKCILASLLLFSWGYDSTWDKVEGVSTDLPRDGVTVYDRYIYILASYLTQVPLEAIPCPMNCLFTKNKKSFHNQAVNTRRPLTQKRKMKKSSGFFSIDHKEVGSFVGDSRMCFHCLFTPGMGGGNRKPIFVCFLVAYKATKRGTTGSHSVR